MDNMSSAAGSTGTETESKMSGDDVDVAAALPQSSPDINKNSNIKVYLRLRPINKVEHSNRSRNCIRIHDNSQTITVTPQPPSSSSSSSISSSETTSRPPLPLTFTFDHVFDPSTPQSMVYKITSSHITHNLLSGINQTLIGYGQTGTGKTHTMMGVGGGVSCSSVSSGSTPHDEHNSHHSPNDEAKKDDESDSLISSIQPFSLDEEVTELTMELDDDDDDETSGMIPRVIRDLFRGIREAAPRVEFTLRCSYVEIYLERIVDLLHPSGRNLCVRETSDAGGYCFVENASEACCFDEADVVALLVRGNACRTMSSTRMNIDSSRSHAVFTLAVEQRDMVTGGVVYSRLQLVDLAGSELGKGLAAGALPEIQIIHKSFIALDQIVDLLSKDAAVAAAAAHAAAAAAAPADPATLAADKTVDAVANASNAQHPDEVCDEAIETTSNVSNGAVITPKDSTINDPSKDSKESNTSITPSPCPTTPNNSAILPYRASKLTALLKYAFGGNCQTSLLLTASPASYSISESINTFNFGQKSRQVINCPRKNEEMSVSELKAKVEAMEAIQQDMKEVIRALNDKCTKMKQKYAIDEPEPDDDVTTVLGNETNSLRNNHTQSTADTILPTKKAKTQNGLSLTETDTDNNNSDPLMSQIRSLQSQLQTEKLAREQAESSLTEIHSEIAILRTQNETLSKKNHSIKQDLIDATNEVDILSSQKLELEHDLHTSQFRENEATMFLRQFRKFYRRLLRNKAAQGTGNAFDVMAKVPGVPDLNDLIDIDIVLYESGLIEEEEMHDDASIANLRPSNEAMMRSTAAAKNEAMGGMPTDSSLSEVTMDESIVTKTKPQRAAAAAAAAVGASGASYEQPSSKNTEEHVEGNKDMSYVGGSKTDLDTISELGDGGVSVIRADLNSEEEDQYKDCHSKLPGNKNSNTNRSPNSDPNSQPKKTSRSNPNPNPNSDIATLTSDLHRMTERCIKLQVALNQERANVDALTNRHNLSASKPAERLAQESIALREALDRKTHDLQAIVWKMNELHLINKTYNEKMLNRDQHVGYLEECLIDLQNKNRALVLDKQDNEAKLREELDNLQVLVDGMTIPLWQFGEIGVTKRTLASRVVIPIRGGCGVGVDGSETDDGEGDADSQRGSSEAGLDANPEKSRGTAQTHDSPCQSPHGNLKHRERLLLQKEEDVQMREDSVEHWMKELEKKKRAVREKELDFELRIQEMQEKEELIRNIQEKLHSTEEEMREWEIDIRRKEDEVLDREEDVNAREDKIDSKIHILKQKEEEFRIMSMAKIREWQTKEDEFRRTHLELLQTNETNQRRLEESQQKNEHVRKDLERRQNDLDEIQQHLHSEREDLAVREQNMKETIQEYETRQVHLREMEQRLQERERCLERDMIELERRMICLGEKERELREKEMSLTDDARSVGVARGMNDKMTVQEESSEVEDGNDTTVDNNENTSLWYYNQFIRNVFHGCQTLICFWKLRWERIKFYNIFGMWTRWWSRHSEQ